MLKTHIGICILLENSAYVLKTYIGICIFVGKSTYIYILLTSKDRGTISILDSLWNSSRLILASPSKKRNNDNSFRYYYNRGISILWILNNDSRENSFHVGLWQINCGGVTPGLA